MNTKLYKTWKEQFKECKNFFHKIYILGKREKYPRIKCGREFSLVLLGKCKFIDNSFLGNGKLYAFGDNSFGQLGLSDTKIGNTIHEVSFDKKIIQMSAGDYHLLVLAGIFIHLLNFLFQKTIKSIRVVLTNMDSWD